MAPSFLKEIYFSTMMALEMLIIVSWITYFIPHDSYPGRLSPLLVVLLAQINILLDVYDDVPSHNTLGWHVDSCGMLLKVK